jgi:hypothetical protein
MKSADIFVRPVNLEIHTSERGNAGRIDDNHLMRRLQTYGYVRDPVKQSAG